MCEGNMSGMLYTATFDENSDSGTTYLGKVHMSRSDKIDRKSF